MDQIKIGKFIAAKRKEKKLTQVELGERLGVSNKSVSKWERGVCLPDVSLYQSLCEELDITLNEFFAGEHIEKDKIEEQSEENIMTITTDHNIKKKKTKRVIALLSVIIVALLISSGFMLNYINQRGYFLNNAVRPYTATSDEKAISKVVSAANDETYIFQYQCSNAKNVVFYCKTYHDGKVTETQCTASPLDKDRGMIAFITNYNRLKTLQYVTTISKTSLTFDEKDNKEGTYEAVVKEQQEKIQAEEKIPLLAIFDFTKSGDHDKCSIDEVDQEYKNFRSCDYVYVYSVVFTNEEI